MTISLRADASRAVVVLDGVDRVAFNEDGSMELLTPLAATDANDVPTFGTSLTSGTAINTTSGTFHDFAGIPSWVKRITIMLSGVSTNGASLVQVQLGAGSIQAAGYTSGGTAHNATNIVVAGTSTTGLLVSGAGAATHAKNGSMVLTRMTPTLWISSATTDSGGGNGTGIAGGSVTLSDTLDRIRLTTVNGTDVFDAGSINILYE